MKTKVLLIVLLIGATCLVVYGRRSPPSYEEMRRMQKQQFEQDQSRQNQRRDRLTERKQRRESGGDLQRLARLEVRVAQLEHALTTKLPYTGRPQISPDLQNIFDAETIRQSKKGKAAIQQAVRSRIIKAIELLESKK